MDNKCPDPLDCAIAEDEAEAELRAAEVLEAAQRVVGISWAVGSLALDDAIAALRATIAKATGG